MRIPAGLALLTVTVLAGASDASGPDVPLPDRIDFNRDVRPVLADTCFKCHGPDPATRKAKLRLDVREDATADREGLFAIVPGKPDESEAYRRLTTHNHEDAMPPEKSGLKLTPRQVQLFRRWIEQGAEYQPHWSFIPPKRPDLPKGKRADWCRSGIDRFILQRLEREGLEPSPEAPKETLIRRVTLDLTGLPPTPKEVDAFLADSSADAYEKLVDRLLASPAYGERMAQAWLDAARYADTGGYQADWERHMWPWRDWVVRAFNDNMPFDQFTVEQIAGDMLPGATLDQRLASGFNRNHRINDEGGIIPEEYAVEYVVDRVETTSAVWLGLTTGCARCHDHKYDPVSQKEFYRLYAYFNNVPEKGQDGRAGFAAPFIRVPAPEASRKIDRLEAEAAELEKQLEAEDAACVARQSEWERQTLAALQSRPAGRWTAPQVVRATAKGPDVHVLKDGSVLMLNVSPDQTTTEVVLRPELERISAIRLEVLTHESLPDRRLGRGDGNFLLGEVAVLAQKPGAKKATPVKLRSAVADHEQEKWSVAHAIDGKPDTGWSVDGDIVRGERTAVFVLEEPIEAKGATLTVRLAQGSKSQPQQTIGRIRLSVTGDGEPAKDPLLPESVVAALQTERAGRTAEQQAELSEHFRWIDPDRRSTREKFVSLRRSALDLAAQGTPVMVMQEMPRPRETYLLKRGQYDQPDKSQKLTPAVPEALSGSLGAQPRNRLELARWLVSPQNPLTARVTVNRYWQSYFGAGIVKTSEDFGAQAEWPTHPELLDWLAVEFQGGGWDVKAMQKLIVTSATYRQSSKLTPHLREKDPDNRLLARGPRLRLDAFAVRDNALAASGLLVKTLGGPPVKPYQPPGLWEELAFMNKTTIDSYVQDKGDKLYRRSMYTFWKRTVPPPAFAIFDASGREMCSVRQARTNTPLQALNLLNDVVYVEAARHLAQRMLREGGKEPAERITYGWRLAMARKPSERELAPLLKSFAGYLEKYKSDPAAAKALLKVGESPRDEKLDVSEHAAYTVVANVLLNLDETITRE